MKSFFKRIVLAIITEQAKYLLRKQKPKVIAIVGSVGKTSTKDAVFAVVSKKFHARKSEKSFNSEFGVPLTILGLPNAWSNMFGWIKNIINGYWILWFSKVRYPEWLVLEIGADKPGDIKSVAQWLSTDIIVMTHIGSVPVHVEFFESVEHLIEEKRSIISSLKKDGVLLVDADDATSLNTREQLVEGQKCITYAEKNASDVNAGAVSIFYENSIPAGMSVDIFYENKKSPLKIEGVLGKQVVYPALAAYGIGTILGVADTAIVDALSHYDSPKGRMHLIEGIRNSVIIDDTYNASPVAMHEALNTLEGLKVGGKKIALLGDMLELGDFSVEEHKKVGARAARVVDVLVTVGVRARGIALGAEDAGMDENNIYQFEKAAEAGEFIQSKISLNAVDIVLAKGSQSIRMERAVEALMLYPENKTQLLVRQDPEWIAKL